MSLKKQKTKAPGEVREAEHTVVKWFKTVMHALVLVDRRRFNSSSHRFTSLEGSG